MQLFIRSNPFVVPLLGLLLSFTFLRFGCDVFLFGLHSVGFVVFSWIFLVFASLSMLLGYVLNFRIWNGQLRLWGLLLFHIALGLQLFKHVGKDLDLPWPQDSSGFALIEVRDSMFLSVKGSGGTVHCSGWQNDDLERMPLNLTFKLAGIEKGKKVPAIGNYWVPVGLLKPYQASEVPLQPNWFSIMRALGVNGHLKWQDDFGRAASPVSSLDRLYVARRWVLVRLRGLLYSKMDPVEAGLIYAMLVGDKSGLDADLEKQFGIGGLLHVLAVSGMHVALIMGALLWIFTGFGTRGKPKIGTLLLLIAAGWMYAFLTGGSASVVRAMISATWMWVGKFAFHRKQKLTHVLAGSGYIQWILDPHCVEQLGFQLSYLAVLGIGTLHLRWIHLYETRNVWRNRLLESVSLTTAATLFTLPLIVWQFQSFPTWFLLGNLLLLPFFTLAVYGALLCLILTGLPVLGDLVFRWFGDAISLLLESMKFLELLPMPQLFSLPLGALGLLFMGLFVFAVDRYFSILERYVASDPQKLKIGKLKFQWLMLLCVVGVWGSAEYRRFTCVNGSETFVLHSYDGDFLVTKNKQILQVEGDLRKSKTKIWLWQRLQNYAVQNEVKHINWVIRLPLHDE